VRLARERGDAVRGGPAGLRLEGALDRARVALLDLDRVARGRPVDRDALALRLAPARRAGRALVLRLAERVADLAHEVAERRDVLVDLDVAGDLHLELALVPAVRAHVPVRRPPEAAADRRPGEALALDGHRGAEHVVDLDEVELRVGGVLPGRVRGARPLDARVREHLAVLRRLDDHVVGLRVRGIDLAAGRRARRDGERVAALVGDVAEVELDPAARRAVEADREAVGAHRRGHRRVAVLGRVGAVLGRGTAAVARA